MLTGIGDRRCNEDRKAAYSCSRVESSKRGFHAERRIRCEQQSGNGSLSDLGGMGSPGWKDPGQGILFYWHRQAHFSGLNDLCSTTATTTVQAIFTILICY